MTCWWDVKDEEFSIYSYSSKKTACCSEVPAGHHSGWHANVQTQHKKLHFNAFWVEYKILMFSCGNFCFLTLSQFSANTPCSFIRASHFPSYLYNFETLLFNSLCFSWGHVSSQSSAYILIIISQIPFNPLLIQNIRVLAISAYQPLITRMFVLSAFWQLAAVLFVNHHAC